MYLVVKSYFYKLHFNYIKVVLLRDRPFNLKGGGGGGGGMVFCFVQKKNFRTTQELKYLFLLSRKVRNFFPEFNIRIYDINSESDYFFFPPKSEYFFQQHWESEYFFRKKTITPPPPFKVNGRSLSPFSSVEVSVVYKHPYSIFHSYMLE